jgi:hypothetical protein
MFPVRGTSFFYPLFAATFSFAQTSPDLNDSAALASGWEASQNAAPDYSFYESPTNFSDGLAPGSILKVEDATNLTNYPVPSGLSMSRIFYTTVDVHNSILPATAYILWPYAALSSDDTQGFPVSCGPMEQLASSNRVVFRIIRACNTTSWSPYLLENQGIAVVAPDYAGLGVGSFPNGTRIQHPWANSPAQANDLAYAPIAARACLPLGSCNRWALCHLGHSQGGRAAWGYAQRQAHSPVSGYRGTVAFAPVADPIGTGF